MPPAQKKFVPLPGGDQAVYIPGAPGSYGYYYRHSDWLGSTRLASTTSRTMYYDLEYAPYGTPYSISGNPDYVFTGMEHTFSNDYDFPAREYSIYGRWPSPDPAGLAAADPTNPQTWNRYAYVLNNPLSFIDPTGLDCQQVGGVITCTVNPPSNICDPSWPSCALAGDGAGNGQGGGVVGPVYCAGNIRCGKSAAVTCTQEQIFNHRSPSACFGAPLGANSAQPASSRQGSLSDQCAGKAWGNFALHGGVDIVGLGLSAFAPGVGGAVASTFSGYAVALMDSTSAEGLTGTSVTLNAVGTGLLVATVKQSSIARFSTRFAESIPGIGIAVGLGQVALDGWNARQLYNACIAHGG